MNTKYIFIVGGVMSGVGKGVAAASIGKILQSKGFVVSAIKIDPYINVDAGTMNPTEHGEVFVTEDGDETDQDVGNYERFLNVNILSGNYMTTGRVYQSVIQKERNLEYKGKCVEVVPHIPEEVIGRIKKAAQIAKADFMIIEVGGTVGEYQNILFLEAARRLHLEQQGTVAFVMVSYLPIPSKIGEMKTKPTQTAVHTLNAAGIQPDFILGRSTKPIDEVRKGKIAVFCNIRPENVISAPDVDVIYEIPINFEREDLGNHILKKFSMKPRRRDLKDWRDLVDIIKTTKKEVKIGIVGKYFKTGDFTLADSYISVIEALKHAAWANKRKAVLTWINSSDFDPAENSSQTVQKNLQQLKKYDGLLIPGGFGSRDIEGKINAIKYAREKKIPYFGICYGMQLAVIEYARNVLKIKDATSEEINPASKNLVIHIMPEQAKLLAQKQYGNTMRLGAYPCVLNPQSISAKAYGNKKISERHRHRYEFNNAYRELLAKAGIVIAGTSPDKNLVEIIELKKDKHPFFVGCQFHPEFKSRPLTPHPLFNGFIKAAISRH